MQLPKSEQLNIASLSRLFDNKSECYKLFWFQAILHHVCKGQQEIRFEDLIDHMIASAWYMVTEYHLNLGPRDKLEEAVNYISSIFWTMPGWIPASASCRSGWSICCRIRKFSGAGSSTI